MKLVTYLGFIGFICNYSNAHIAAITSFNSKLPYGCGHRIMLDMGYLICAGYILYSCILNFLPKILHYFQSVCLNLTGFI